MRKAFFKAKDGSFEYSFGCDVSIIYDVMHHPKAKCIGDLEYEATLTGYELIRFIKKSAKAHSDIIEKIVPSMEYVVSAWDW